jgi:hypothetical protein
VRRNDYGKVQGVDRGRAWATPRSVFKFPFLVHELLHVNPDSVQIKGAVIIIKFNLSTMDTPPILVLCMEEINTENGGFLAYKSGGPQH